MTNYRFENELEALNWHKTYSFEESAQIKQGFLAKYMDDKWDFVFSNDELLIYRSWTGIGLYKLEFENLNGSLTVKRALVDSKFLKNFSHDFCATLLNQCIEFSIFNRTAESPSWEN